MISYIKKPPPKEMKMKKRIVWFLFILLQACTFSPYHLNENSLYDGFYHTDTRILHDPPKQNYRLLFSAQSAFKPKSAVLSPSLMSQLDILAEIIKAYPFTTAAIHGYTDNAGTTKSNQALSERRAHAVISYLESQGIGDPRLITIGHGEKDPRYPKQNDLNRRVEITLHYNGSCYRS